MADEPRCRDSGGACRRARPLRPCGRGLGGRAAAAVELAIVLPVLVLLVLGLIDFARVIWVQAALDYAVEAAARCGAVDAAQCGTTAGIQAYAVGAAPGLDISPSAFSVATASCGVRVSATFSFEFVFPMLPVETVTLTAVACYPS